MLDTKWQEPGPVHSGCDFKLIFHEVNRLLACAKNLQGFGARNMTLTPPHQPKYARNEILINWLLASNLYCLSAAVQYYMIAPAVHLHS